MNFVREEVGKDGPSTLLAEHVVLVNWLTRHPAYGSPGDLTDRLCDKDRHCALYFITGLGRNEGERFALVYRHDVVIVDLFTGGGPDLDVLPVPEVEEISFCEGSTWPKAAIIQCIVAALAAYGHAPLTFEKATWDVIPQSRLAPG